MDRRDFLKYSATGIIGLSLPLRWTSVQAKDEEGYNLIILGDTHYDAKDPEYYHAGYHLENTKREMNHRREFVRNGNMWSGRCKDLVKRAACLVDDDSRCVLQMGDLIQGDTADAATHKRFLEDAMNLFKESLAGDLPFVSVCGNHDVRGNDDDVCAQAYSEYMLPRLSAELEQEVNNVNFLFRVGPDAFVVIDFTHPDVPRIEKLLAQAADARHVFVVVHSPVFPYDDAKYYWWHLLGNREDSRAEERRHIRKLLAGLNAIVLCGHVHTTELLDWYGDGGRITQMTMSSVWSSADRGTYKEVANGAKEYGKLTLEEQQGKPTKEAVAALFAEHRAGIKTYSKSYAAGSYKLCVKGPHVYINFYAGDNARVSKKFVLR